MKLWILFLTAFIAFHGVAQAGDAIAVREGSGGAGGATSGSARPKPSDNPNCNREALSACKAERKQALSDCKWSLLNDCKGHVSLDYSDCKADSGC